MQAPKKFLTIIITLILLALGLGVYIWIEESQYNNLEFIVLDVGQGDAILIKTPYKQNVLIDGGPNKSVVSGIDRHLPFWRRKIDLMILTHPDADHVTGLVEVLRIYPVSRVMGTGVAHTLPAYIEWLNIIKEEEIPFDIAWAPMRIELGKDLWMDILWPIDNFAGINVDDNNETSIIAKLVYGDISFLLTGDATIGVEKELMSCLSTSTDLQLDPTSRLGSRQAVLQENYGASARVDLKSDVLKVGHHGSKGSTSLEFVKLVNPVYAVISVGADNRFGHPTRRVLKNLKDVGVVILRTDESGDIKISSDGKSIYLLNESQ